MIVHGKILVGTHEYNPDKTVHTCMTLNSPAIDRACDGVDSCIAVDKRDSPCVSPPTVTHTKNTHREDTAAPCPVAVPCKCRIHPCRCEQQ